MGGFVQQFSFGAADDGPDRPEPSRPSWMEPEDELGVAVPLGVVVARSEQGVVAVSHAIVHGNGVSFSFVALARGLTRRVAQQLFHEQHHADSDDLGDGFLRIGLELADGTRVSNLGRRRPWGPGRDEEPEGPLFFHHGGGGSMGHGDSATLHNDYWLWPLPPAGPIRVSCEWPIVGIPLATVEVDGALAAAAAGVVPLWPSP